MIAKVTIKPINALISDQALPASYQWRNKFRMLMDDNSIVECDLVEQKDKPRPPQRLIKFDKNNRSLEYSYETDEKLQNAIDKKIQMSVIDFWKNHPMVTTNGKSVPGVTKHPMFDIVNANDKSLGELKRWKEILSVANKINELNYQDKVNIAYYFGENPQSLTENELIMRLANFETGICISEGEIDSFLRIWVRNEDSDKDMIVNARKALNYNIIEEKSSDGKNSYYLGETFLGTCFPDILSYCKREEKIYQDYIVRQVNDKENVKGAKKEAVKSSSGIPVAPVTSPLTPTGISDLEELRKEAVQLKKDKFLWIGFNIEKAPLPELTKIVNEARAKKIAKQGVPA